MASLGNVSDAFLWKEALVELQQVLVEGFVKEMTSANSETSYIRNSQWHTWNDMELKSDFFHNLAIPLRLESGHIGQITTDIDIAVLFARGRAAKEYQNKEFIVRIKDIKLHVAPSGSTRASYREVLKHLSLAVEELFHNYFQQSSGLYDMFLRTKFEIENLHIKYEDQRDDIVYHITCKSIQQLKNETKGRAALRRNKRKRRRRRKPQPEEEQPEDDEDVPVSVVQVRQLSFTQVKVDEQTGNEIELKILKPCSFVVNAVHEYVESADEADKIRKKKERQKSQKDRDRFWGASFVIVTSTPVELTLTEETVPGLLTTANKVFRWLFETADANSAAQDLDLLRWFPVQGHVEDYWKIALRTALPAVISRVAQKQKIDMPKEWAQVYSIMSPAANKERYISLFQRSLNLVNMDVLSTSEVTELKELEKHHATDTIKLWRAEAKIRLKMERPDPSSRIPRKQLSEIQGGVVGAILEVYQEVLPSRVLSAKEKRDALKKALSFMLASLTEKTMEGINTSVVISPEAGGISLTLVPIDKQQTITLFANDLNLEIDYNTERTLLQAIASGFQEHARGGVQRAFTQKNGRLDFFTRFPHSTARGVDRKVISALFMQRVKIISLQDLSSRLGDFFLRPYSHWEEEQHISEDEKKKSKLKEIDVDVVLVDSSVGISPAVAPTDASLYKVDIRAGNPDARRSTARGRDKHLSIQLTIKPRSNSTHAKMTCNDVSLVYEASAIERVIGSTQVASITPDASGPLVKHIGDLTVEARSCVHEAGDEDDAEEFTVQVTGGNVDLCMSQLVVADLLRVAANMAARSEKDLRHHHRSGPVFGPFSYRAYVASADLVPDNAPSNAAKQGNDKESLEDTDTLILSLNGIDFSSHQLQLVEEEDSKEPAKPSAASLLSRVAKESSTTDLMSAFLDKLFQHLVQGITSSGLSVAMMTEARRRHQPLSPILLRMRQLVLAGAPWSSSLVDVVSAHMEELLVFDMKLPGRDYVRGVRVHHMDAVLPQGMSEVLLDAHIMHSKHVLDNRADPIKAADLELDPSVRNVDYCEFHFTQLEFVEEVEPKNPGKLDLLLDQVLADQGNSIVAEWNGAGIVSQYAEHAVPFPVPEHQLFFHIGSLDFRLRILSADFVNGHVEGFLRTISRREALHAKPEPNMSIDDLNVVFDVRLLESFLESLMHSRRVGTPLHRSTWNAALIATLRACHTHAVFVGSLGSWDPEPFMSRLVLHEFKWRFQRHNNDDAHFLIKSNLLLAIPYSFFSESRDEETHSLLMRGALELDYVLRRTPLSRSLPYEAAPLSDDEEAEEELDKLVERMLINGRMKNIEILHVAPPNWKPPPPDKQLHDNSNESKDSSQGDSKGNDDDNDSGDDQENEQEDPGFLLPSLPLYAPVEKSNIRGVNNAILYKIAAEVLEPCTIDFEAVVEDSGLHVHSSKEDLQRCRKSPGVHTLLRFKSEDEVRLHVSYRDVFFIGLALARYAHTRRGVASELNFEFIINHEMDIHVDFPRLFVSLLDHNSNQERKNPVLELALSQVNAHFTDFASRAGLILESTLDEVKYGYAPESQHGDVTVPDLEAATTSVLHSSPTPFNLSVFRDVIANEDLTQSLTTNLNVLKDFKPLLSIPFVTNTLPRLHGLKRIKQLIDFSVKLDFDLLEEEEENSDDETDEQKAAARRAKREEEEEKRKLEEDDITVDEESPEDAARRKAEEESKAKREEEDKKVEAMKAKNTIHRITQIHNATGSTVWVTRDINKGGSPVVLGDDQTLEIDLNETPDIYNLNTEAADYAISVRVDGGWQPSLKVDMLPGFHSVQTVSAGSSSFLALGGARTVNVVCGTELSRTHSKYKGFRDTQLTLHLHSAVRVFNTTTEPVEWLDGLLPPGEHDWLPLMAASNGILQLRPTEEHSWTPAIKFAVETLLPHPREKMLLRHLSVVHSKHTESGIDWTYYVKIIHSRLTGVTDIYVSAPISFTNCLPFPITLRVVRRAKHNRTTFFFDRTTSRQNSQTATSIERRLSNHADEDDLDQSVSLQRPFQDLEEDDQQGNLDHTVLDDNVPTRELNITHHVERGLLQPDSSWESHGGEAFEPGQLELLINKSSSVRLDGLRPTRRLPLHNVRRLENGWTLRDGLTDRELRVFVADVVTSPTENKFHRELRIFCHYLFVDRTNLQLRFTEDQISWMTSHYRNPTKEAGIARESLIPFSSHYDLNAQRKIQVSSPRARRWSAPLLVPAPELTKQGFVDHTGKTALAQAGGDPNSLEHKMVGTEVVDDAQLMAFDQMRGVFASAVKRAENDPDSAPQQHPPYHIVRVPTGMRLATADKDHVGRGHKKMHACYCTEVVASVTFPYGRIGPSKVTFKPRVRIVNNLNFGLALRSRHTLSFRKESGSRGYAEPPLFLPAGYSTAWHFWDNTENEDLQAQHPPALHLPSVAMLPVFLTGNPASPFQGTWEWSAPIPTSKSRVYLMSIHNTQLTQRIVLKVEVVLQGPHHIMVISTYNPLELPYKLQNLASLCSVRFAQHRHESPDPTRHSRFWQTVVPDARTVSFAWDDPVNEGLAINSSLAAISGPNSKPKPAAGPSLSDDPVGALGNLGYQVYDAIAQPLGLGAPPERPKVKRVRQYPFLVTLQVFTHKEVFEIDFDISLARVGSRMRLKLPGGRPDVVVQTRIESTTGAVVLVVSDYLPSERSFGQLHSYETEEKKFIHSLMTREEKVVTTLTPSKSQYFPEERPTDEWNAPPQYAALSISLDSLVGVNFAPESSVVCVVSYAKISRRVVFYDPAVGKRNTTPIIFTYNEHHVPGDPDYQEIHVDVYERHPATGTTLRRTSTFRDVQRLLDEANDERGVEIESVLFPRSFRRVDSKQTPREPMGVLRVAVKSATHGFHGLDHVPGHMVIQTGLNFSRIDAAISDIDQQTALKSVVKSHGGGAQEAIEEGIFMHVDWRDAKLFFGQTSSHDFLDFTLQSSNVLKHFQDRGQAVPELVLNSNSNPEELPGAPAFLSLSALRHSEVVPAVSFAYEHPGTITDTSHPIDHCDVLDLHFSPVYVKADSEVALRVLGWASEVGLFDHLVDKPKLEESTTGFVRELTVHPSPVHVSATSAAPPSLVGGIADTVLESSAAATKSVASISTAVTGASTDNADDAKHADSSAEVSGVALKFRATEQEPLVLDWRERQSKFLWGDVLRTVSAQLASQVMDSTTQSFDVPNEPKVQAALQRVADEIDSLAAAAAVRKAEAEAAAQAEEEEEQEKASA